MIFKSTKVNVIPSECDFRVSDEWLNEKSTKVITSCVIISNKNVISTHLKCSQIIATLPPEPDFQIN